MATKSKILAIPLGTIIVTAYQLSQRKNLRIWVAVIMFLMSIGSMTGTELVLWMVPAHDEEKHLLLNINSIKQVYISVKADRI